MTAKVRIRLANLTNFCEPVAQDFRVHGISNLLVPSIASLIISSLASALRGNFAAVRLTWHRFASSPNRGSAAVTSTNLSRRLRVVGAASFNSIKMLRLPSTTLLRSWAVLRKSRTRVRFASKDLIESRNVVTPGHGFQGTLYAATHRTNPQALHSDRCHRLAALRKSARSARPRHTVRGRLRAICHHRQRDYPRAKLPVPTRLGFPALPLPQR